MSLKVSDFPILPKDLASEVMDFWRESVDTLEQLIQTVDVQDGDIIMVTSVDTIFVWIYERWYRYHQLTVFDSDGLEKVWGKM